MSLCVKKRFLARFFPNVRTPTVSLLFSESESLQIVVPDKEKTPAS